MARGKAKGKGRNSPRRRAGASEDGGSRWLTSYGDTVTLLLAFFVMLYAMSHIDQVKFEAFLQGLQVPFGNTAANPSVLASGPSLIEQGGVAVQNPPVRPDLVTPPDVLAAERAATRPEPSPPPPAAAPPTARTDGGRVVDLEGLEEVRRAIQAALDQAGLAHAAELRMDERGLIVSIAADDVLFATGATAISELGRRIIGAVAPTLTRFSNEILVEGHTDTQPIRRADYSNWHLSTDRAVAVLTLLYSEHGIAQPRLVAGGFGEHRPRAPNDSAEGRALNRRVEIVVVAEGALR